MTGTAKMKGGMGPMYRNYFYIVLRLLFVLAVIVGGFFLIYFVAKLTVPFIIALIVAFLMNPLVKLLNQKARIPRGLSVLIALILIVGVIAGLIALLIIEIISGVKYLTEVVPDKVDDLIDYFERIFASTIMPLYDKVLDMFNNLDTDQRHTVLTNIQEIGKTLTGALGDLGQSIVTGLTAFMGALPNFAVILVFAILGTFFISKDWDKLASKMTQAIPDPVTSNVGRIYRDLKRAMLGFVRAQLTLVSITGVIVLIGLFILRVDYAFTIAIITGIVDLLPYLGTGLVFVPWIIYMFFSGNYFLSIGLSVLYAIVVIQRQMMEPKIVSSSIGLNPLATLVAIFVALQLFGFIGFIIGPIALVILKTLYQAHVFHDLWRFIIGKEAS